MSNPLGKWKQKLLLQQNPLTAKSIPQTSIYSLANLLDFINRYEYIFVKHDTSGQGRGIFKVYKRNELYCFNGFSIQGDQINKCVPAIKDFHKVLHPFEKFGKLGNYIIQEGVKSLALNGLPISIRVHVQNLKGKWVIGGMYGKIGTAATIENGIVNAHRGAQVVSIDDLLSVHLKMGESDKKDAIDSLKKISITAAKVIATHFPCREYGIDFGLEPKGKPVLLEVNSTPGISGFAHIENKVIWKRIVKNRKIQNEIDS
ncbi:YheC/YheD family protein [Lederbergia citrea]|uniref:YheC/YheD family protein n=1 Tax=Lederbergia citrea TaxID=2833581 RepID=A0A942UN91_9BACI|nr:YheC/YheD family protein [Lederbergia citrea]MBS4205995.1 YheC/YheD family protein [Lederbergia citrea]MBS4224556.1 YheC/YheD family protein [Lederbergia citrea]